MEQRSFTYIIEKIRDVADKIIKDIYPIYKQMENDPQSFVDKINQRLTDKQEATRIIDTLKSFLMTTVSDPLAIKEEIDSFIQTIKDCKINKDSKISKDSKIDKGVSKDPLLTLVWFGDVYDTESKIESFILLLIDLEKTLNNINHEYFINQVVKDFNK